MTIERARWARYRVPFRRPFVTQHGVIERRDGAILLVETAAGLVGIGEIALPPGFAGDPLDEALAGARTAASALIGLTTEAALARLAELDLAAGGRFALETALLDLLGRERDIPLADALRDLVPLAARERATSVAVNAVIDGGNSEAVAAATRAALAAGFESFKLKIGTADGADAEVGRVAATRAIIGPARTLRLDANEGWSAARALDILARCAPFDIEYCEQPVPAANVAGMAWLRQHLRQVPIAADEAVTSVAAATDLLAREAADVLVLKPAALGGLRAALAVDALARAAGVRCVVTSALESGVGVLAALHLAALVNPPGVAAGLATVGLLADDLVDAMPPIAAGHMAVPGPGLGARLDWPALERYLVAEGE